MTGTQTVETANAVAEEIKGEIQVLLLKMAKDTLLFVDENPILCTVAALVIAWTLLDRFYPPKEQ